MGIVLFPTIIPTMERYCKKNTESMWVLGQHATTNRTKYGTIVGMARKDKNKKQQTNRQMRLQN